MASYEYVMKELVRVLENLSSSLDGQVNYLRKLGTYPIMDELALEFDDVYVLLQIEKNPYSLSTDSLESLKKLDAFLDLKSGDTNKDFWDIEIADKIEWEIVRNMSKEILGKLRESKY